MEVLQMTEDEMRKLGSKLGEIYNQSKYARLIAWMMEIDDETVMKEKLSKLYPL